MVKRLFIPDLHAPFHDASAWSILLNVGKDFKPDEVVILGDFFDCYSVSKYDKHPQKMYADLEQELLSGKEELARLVRLLKPKKIFYCLGNHEWRLERFIASTAGVMYSTCKSIPEILELPKNCITKPYGQNGWFNFDGLYVMHGYVTGKTPAMKALERYGRSVLFGHTHRIQEAHKKILNGPTIRAYNCGWLGDMEKAAEYIQDTADWSHGFATGLFPKSGNWTINLHTIIDYQVVVNGKHYTPKYSKQSR